MNASIGNYKHRALSLLVASVVISTAALGGCSNKGTQPKTVKPDDYLTVEQGPSLQTESTAVSSTYQVPVLSEQVAAQALGKSLDIRPPALVLTIPEGSRSATGEQVALRFSPAGGGSQQLGRLSQQLWQALTDFARQPDMVVESADAQQRTLRLQQDLGQQPSAVSGLFGKESSELLQLFELKLSPAIEPGGFQSGWQVDVQLQDLISNQEGVDFDSLSESDKRRVEIALLNQFSGFYQTLQDDLRDAETALSGRIELTLSQDSSGVPAFVADSDFDPVWKRLPEALQGMSFKVNDRNRALGTYYVEYDPPLMKSVGLFGKEKTTTAPNMLRQVDYEVQLGVMAGKTSITFHTDGGKPLTEEEMASFYEQFAAQMRGVSEQGATQQ